MYMPRAEDENYLDGKETSPGLRSLLERNGIKPTGNAALDVKTAKPLMLSGVECENSPKATLRKMLKKGFKA